MTAPASPASSFPRLPARPGEASPVGFRDTRMRGDRPRRVGVRHGLAHPPVQGDHPDCPRSPAYHSDRDVPGPDSALPRRWRDGEAAPRPYDGPVHPECDPRPVGVRRCLTCRPGGSAKSSLASDATALSRSTAIARRRWSAALRRGRRCTAPSLPSPWPSQVRPSAKTMCGKKLPFRKGQAVSDPPVRQPGTSQSSAMATA